MTQFNLSLLPSVEAYLHQKISQGRYKNLEDYLYHLILEDQKRNSQEKLETLLIAGLESGTPLPITEDWWEQKKAELVKKTLTSPYEPTHFYYAQSQSRYRRSF